MGLRYGRPNSIRGLCKRNDMTKDALHPQADLHHFGSCRMQLS